MQRENGAAVNPLCQGLNSLDAGADLLLRFWVVLQEFLWSGEGQLGFT